ncbi:MAG TPA: uroporphyrinogen decarboxylase family protein [Candidatus Methylomirabilis sp.]|nr:uroporphyrinogen decarboxylase family protein [Candidatus Methylomirabilis sp.]
MAMTSRQRVLAALQLREPDRVPYCELGVDRALAERLMGWGAPTNQAANLEANAYTVEEAKALARHLHLDNISYVLRAPVFAHKVAGQDGRLFYGEGMIKTEADLALLQLPDPHDDSLYAEAEHFIQNTADFSAWFVTRIGIFPTMLSLGLENFSLALYDNRPFIETILDRYCDWIVVVADRACRLGFDVFASTDDMAFNTAPFFSLDVFRELVLPRYRKVAKQITLPWIIHSDGNILPFVDDLLSVGISGLHPNEKGPMDIRAMKREYGDRLCLLGNVDLNLLGMGSPEAVDREVRELIRDVGPGGGYIVTSGNSLAAYLVPENVLALSRAVQTYGRYPLSL